MNVILMGGGKFAGLLYTLFAKQYDFIGYLDDINTLAYIEEQYHLINLGNSKNMSAIFDQCRNVFISIGSEGDTLVRGEYFQRFLAAGFSFPTLIHPSAFVANNASIDIGTTVHVNAVIHAKAVIGKNCVISTNAMISHDTIIGDNVYVAPGALINGSNTIGDNTFIGTGAVVIQKRKIGKNCLIGAGACVIQDIQDNCRVGGVPARPI